MATTQEGGHLAGDVHMVLDNLEKANASLMQQVSEMKVVVQEKDDMIDILAQQVHEIGNQESNSGDNMSNMHTKLDNAEMSRQMGARGLANWHILSDSDKREMLEMIVQSLTVSPDPAN